MLTVFRLRYRPIRRSGNLAQQVVRNFWINLVSMLCTLPGRDCLPTCIGRIYKNLVKGRKMNR